jgi:hypothetical protein
MNVPLLPLWRSPQHQQQHQSGYASRSHKIEHDNEVTHIACS